MENSTETQTRLLPCPFCGGEPSIKQTGHNKYRIRCESCHIGVEQKHLKYSADWLKSKMINDWNNRIHEY